MAFFGGATDGPFHQPLPHQVGGCKGGCLPPSGARDYRSAVESEEQQGARRRTLRVLLTRHQVGGQ